MSNMAQVANDLEYQLRDAENKIDQLSMELRDAEAMAESVRDFGKWLEGQLMVSAGEGVADVIYTMVLDRYNQIEGA